MHADMKLSNILTDKKLKQIVIADFGISKMIQ